MPAQLLDGKLMAAELEEELKKRVEALAQKGYTPGLTVILVGDDPASQTYVSNKEKACARLGIRSRTLRMPADTTQETLEAAIREANADPSVNGILVQLPLPRHLDGDRALSLILPEKDVDGCRKRTWTASMISTRDACRAGWTAWWPARQRARCTCSSGPVSPSAARRPWS